jgi:fido (protein-threonine AMPylation protein)
MDYGEIVVKQAYLAKIALGMFCHKEMYHIFENGNGLSVLIFGDILSQKIEVILSWRRIMQGTDRPGDGSSRRRFVQATVRPVLGS